MFRTILFLLFLAAADCSNKETQQVQKSNEAADIIEGDDNPRLEEAGSDVVDVEPDEETLTGSAHSLEQKGLKQRVGKEKVSFGFDKYKWETLSASDLAYLDSVAKDLKINADITIEIKGNCDIRGNLRYNIHLSLKRAEAVKSYLVSKGISAHRIKTVGLGTQIFTPGDTEEAYAENRIAIITVVGSGVIAIERQKEAVQVPVASKKIEDDKDEDDDWVPTN